MDLYFSAIILNAFRFAKELSLDDLHSLQVHSYFHIHISIFLMAFSPKLYIQL